MVYAFKLMNQDIDAVAVVHHKAEDARQNLAMAEATVEYDGNQAIGKSRTVPLTFDRHDQSVKAVNQCRHVYSMKSAKHFMSIL
jgi:hypothetical protein